MADVLGLDVVARSAPRVVAGNDMLSAPVQWVHTSELMWAGRTWQARQLLLTCGAPFPPDDAEIDSLFAALAEAEVAAVVVALGRRYPQVLPVGLVDAAERHRVVLVTLEPEADLNEIAEAVNLAIAEERWAALTAAEDVHQVFTELALEGASPWEVVRQIALMAGRPVVLENLAHQMLAYASANEDPARLLAGWEKRSRRIPAAPANGTAVEDGWLTATVGARGKDWGRLLLLPAACGARGTGKPVSSELPSLILRRGAQTLALNQLIGSGEEYVERQAHAALLQGVLTHSLTTKEVALRSCAMGLPLEDTQLVGLAVQQHGSSRPSRSDTRCLEELVVTVLQQHRIRALVAALDNGAIAVLMTVEEADALKVVDSFSRTVRARTKEYFGRFGARGERERHGQVVITVGPTVASIHEARRSLMCAFQTLKVALRSHYSFGKAPYIRPQDLRLTGLLRLLHDDSRLQTFVENEIGPLLAYDARHGTDLASVLTHYLDSGRNKTAAAEAAQLSRPSLYERLERIERILEVKLDDPRSCLSLQVATHALHVIRQLSAI
ncbi:PucR family transcriptional regulator ligand-binding domain-containing protein [Streptomyces sp. NPDC085932]|uniref:helix-turn-helix domain-containing protein n=1 Tax=Streptomyces sp. NPDC085932 TaxID=3365741 RepID=UPI0037D8446A